MSPKYPGDSIKASVAVLPLILLNTLNTGSKLKDTLEIFIYLKCSLIIASFCYLENTVNIFHLQNIPFLISPYHDVQRVQNIPIYN